jgi:Protein of unknown function (DUF2934)
LKSFPRLCPTRASFHFLNALLPDRAFKAFINHLYDKNVALQYRRFLMQDLEHAIRERAYHLWIADGRPEGNADDYWLSAQREILATSLNSTETAASPTMHSVSGTTKPLKKPRASRSGKGKSRAA